MISLSLSCDGWRIVHVLFQYSPPCKPCFGNADPGPRACCLLSAVSIVNDNGVRVSKTGALE
jgi:hypothetical protein